MPRMAAAAVRRIGRSGVGRFDDGIPRGPSRTTSVSIWSNQDDQIANNLPTKRPEHPGWPKRAGFPASACSHYPNHSEGAMLITNNTVKL